MEYESGIIVELNPSKARVGGFSLRANWSGGEDVITRVIIEEVDKHYVIRDFEEGTIGVNELNERDVADVRARKYLEDMARRMSLSLQTS